MSLANKTKMSLANKLVVSVVDDKIRLENKKGVRMTNLLNEMELAFCDVCGNYVPVTEVDGDLFCAYEYAEYPDIANIVG
jgi:hypothetical protein